MKEQKESILKIEFGKTKLIIGKYQLDLTRDELSKLADELDKFLSRNSSKIFYYQIPYWLTQPQPFTHYSFHPLPNLPSWETTCGQPNQCVAGNLNQGVGNLLTHTSGFVQQLT